MHHKRGRGKAARAGCLLCNPNKLPCFKKSRRRRERSFWEECERRADEGGFPGRGRTRAMSTKVVAW